MTASGSRESSPELARAMGPVARELLGAPNARLSSATELRFGTNGSKSVNLPSGTWFDHEANEGGGVLDLVHAKLGLINGAALGWLEEHGHIQTRPDRRTREGGGAKAHREVATYDYTDADGAVLFQVVRLQPKSFRQRRPNGAGGWLWGLKGVQRVPYRLPELLAAIAAGEPLFICEGEKSCDLLAAAGLAATCSPMGAGKWLDVYSPWLNGADVIVLPDADEPGERHCSGVTRALAGFARRARVLRLPDLPVGGDVADWLAAGGTPEELLRLAAEAPLADATSIEDGERSPTRKERPKREEREPSGNPVIRITAGDLHKMATAAEDAVIAAGAAIYQRRNSLVRPITRETAASKGRITITAALMEMKQARMMDVFCQVADWQKFDGRSGAWVRANPPRDLAEILLSRAGFWRVPTLVGVITTPTLRADGSILSANGYDPATRLYHVANPSLTLSEATRDPTRADAEAALGLLEGLLQGFPFVSSVSRAVALSAVMTPVVRGAMPVAPMHLFRAPTPGSGKSYMVDVASAIVSGRPCPVITAAQDRVETEKRLLSVLLDGTPLVSLDNMNGDLASDLLCQAIERPVIKLRPLGTTQGEEIESSATFMATGNNARVVGDLVRRTLVSDLDAGLERPELREFKSDPVATVLADRGSYVSACLIIVRAYLLAGQPGKLKPIASFEAWSDLVRSALVWLGCADPADSIEQAREDDPELGELRETLTAWREAFGAEAVTVRYAIDTATTPVAQADEHGDYHHHGATALPYPALKDALLRVAGVRGAIDAKRLGAWLNARKSRPVGRDSFRRGPDTRTKVGTWMVQSISQ